MPNSMPIELLLTVIESQKRKKYVVKGQLNFNVVEIKARII